MNKMLDVEQGIKTDTEMESEEAPAEQAIELVEDMRNASNPQYCVEYAQEIFVHLIRTESKLAPSGNYMDTVPFPTPDESLGVILARCLCMSCSCSMSTSRLSAKDFLWVISSTELSTSSNSSANKSARSALTWAR